MSNQHAPKMVDGIEIPHPEKLQVRVRDFSLLVKHATFPCPEWEQELREMRLLLLLAEAVHGVET